MREITAKFVILAPLLILLADLIVYRVFGYYATITGVIREWHEASDWCEVIFIVGVTLLYYHLFREWPK